MQIKTRHSSVWFLFSCFLHCKLLLLFSLAPSIPLGDVSTQIGCRCHHSPWIGLFEQAIKQSERFQKLQAHFACMFKGFFLSKNSLAGKNQRGRCVSCGRCEACTRKDWPGPCMSKRSYHFWLRVTCTCRRQEKLGSGHPTGWCKHQTLLSKCGKE